MFGKILFGSVFVIGGAAVLVPPFGKKLDRNIIRPIRDYNEHLKSYNDFKTEEEFISFVKDLSGGVVRMFKFED